jgi:Jacalin-like lectin domain
MPGVYGPSGGPGGGEWEILPPDSGTGVPSPYAIASLIIYSGQFIDSIQVVYRNTNDGTTAISEKIGGPGGGEKVFSLASGESIQGFGGTTGTAGDAKKDDYVSSLAIQKNTDSGEQTIAGTPNTSSYFTYAFSSTEELYGFWGRGGAYIDAIGVFTRPPRTP